MAIRFGMTLAEMIVQLTKGFRKATGRNPDGLEKIKIQQEAVRRFKDMNKVVDMEGNVLDPSKPIMGGTQEGAALRSGIMRATGEGPREITEDTGAGFIDFVRKTDPEGAAKLQKEEDRIRAMIEAANKRAAKNMKSDEEIGSNIKKSNERSVQNLRMQMMDDKVANDMFQGVPSRDPKTDADMLAEFIAEDAGKIYDDLPTKERIKFYDRAYNAILRYKRKDPEDMADGGRIGYKLGGFKNLFDFFNKKNPIQAYKDYLKSIKDRMKAGKELEVASEVLPIAGGGMLINRALKKKLESMSKEDVERKKERDDKAYGGRIGFKKGMDRRTVMKMVGGLTALPILGKLFKGAEVAAPVVEKAVDVASGAPPYFFNLVDRIRALGTKFAGPKERSEFFRYKDYEMDIDYDTGVIEIKKTKEAMIPGGDEAGVSEEVYMPYKPGRGDEATKGTPADEYEEFTARPDIDGKMKDVEEGVPDEVVREGSIGKEQLEEEIVEQIARDKKASGGLAYMLGE